MPFTLTEHVEYTSHKLNNCKYFKDLFEILEKNTITSYLDIGANTGEFCNQMFKKIKTLKKAYLIESVFENFIFLKDNIIYKKETDYYCNTIGYNLENPKLYMLHNNVGGYLLIDSCDLHNFSEIPKVLINDNIKNLCTMESLDFPIVDFIKIDIEGGEFNLIDNSSYIQNIKLIDVEFHWYPWLYPTYEDKFNYIKTKFPQHSVIQQYNDCNIPFVHCLLEKK